MATDGVVAREPGRAMMTPSHVLNWDWLLNRV